MTNLWLNQKWIKQKKLSHISLQFRRCVIRHFTTLHCLSVSYNFRSSFTFLIHSDSGTMLSRFFSCVLVSVALPTQKNRLRNREVSKWARVATFRRTFTFLILVIHNENSFICHHRTRRKKTFNSMVFALKCDPYFWLLLSLFLSFL